MKRNLTTTLVLAGAFAVFAAPSPAADDRKASDCISITSGGAILGGVLNFRNNCPKPIYMNYCVVDPATSIAEALSCASGFNGPGQLSPGGEETFSTGEAIRDSRIRWFACYLPTLPEDWDPMTNRGFCRTAKESAAARRKGRRPSSEAGLTRDDRRSIQRALRAQGFDPGPADRVFGPRSRAAVQAWQAARGSVRDGVLTAGQMGELLAAGAPDVVASVDGGVERAAPAVPPGKAAGSAPASSWTAGHKFRDCSGCPELVVVPSGSFWMGSPSGEERRNDNEGPQHRVTFERPFAVGVYEVTFGEWAACVSGGGCGGHRPGDEGWGRGRHPVINVSWDDAKAYVKWLSGKTGKQYRLLSESEWEYAARAGTETAFHTGRTISTEEANYDGNYGSGRRGRYRERTTPVGSFEPNGFGLHDVHGNVWEWVEDCWNINYRRALDDGSAWLRGDCGKRVLRGGSWSSIPRGLRSANRFRSSSGNRLSYLGFRVARTLD